MTEKVNRNSLMRPLWLGALLTLAGQIVDFRWHATHEEFEGASDQLQAHWLLWIGVLTLLATLAIARLSLKGRERNVGFAITSGAAVGFALVSVWHFIAHASGQDPGVAHALLAITEVGIYAGVIAATLLARRRVAAI